MAKLHGAAQHASVLCQVVQVIKEFTGATRVNAGFTMDILGS
jgi:hypothetical protein